MFRKEAISSILPFRYRYIWDYELYIRIISSNLGEIVNINQNVIQKRIHVNSTYNTNWKLALKELLEIRKNIITKNNL